MLYSTTLLLTLVATAQSCRTAPESKSVSDELKKSFDELEDRHQRLDRQTESLESAVSHMRKLRNRLTSQLESLELSGPQLDAFRHRAFRCLNSALRQNEPADTAGACELASSPTKRQWPAGTRKAYSIVVQLQESRQHLDSLFENLPTIIEKQARFTANKRLELLRSKADRNDRPNRTGRQDSRTRQLRQQYKARLAALESKVTKLRQLQSEARTRFEQSLREIYLALAEARRNDSRASE